MCFQSSKMIYLSHGWQILVLLHPLSNIEITKYFNYEPRFNGVFLKGNLSRIKDRANVINLNDKQSKSTPWVSLVIDRSTALYFDSFRIEYIPQELLNKIKDKSITRNILRIQFQDSIICRFYCIAFIEYMIAGKTLLNYTNLFSPNDYKKNDKIIRNYFKDKYSKRKHESCLLPKK